jgi:hypothetical protein
VDEAKKRDNKRQKKYDRPEVVEEMHAKHAYPDKEDIVVNTGELSIEQTIDTIKRLLKD